jgi:hypothetical protein
MARVTYGESITEYAGSIGGVTFLRNASGPIAKLRANPPVNPSPGQAYYQQRMAYLISYWPTLSQANKDTWDAHALAHDHTTPWGIPKTLSGYQWFILCNMLRMHFHTSPINVPSAWVAYSPTDQFTIETSSTYIRVAWVPDYTPTHLLIYGSLPLRQSSLKLRRSLYYLKYDVAGAPRSNIDLTSDFETLLNVTWSTFYASADCNLIIRILNGSVSAGWFSAFTSAITKIS